MRTFFNHLFFFILGVALVGCHSGKHPVGILSIPTKSAEAISPFLSTDEQGEAVLCWTEKDPKDSLFSVKYSHYNSSEGTFGPVITVAGSEGAQTGAESMNKVAFKSDGTVIAVFGKKFLGEKNRFAGAIYYTVSTDKGRSWSKPEFLHSDTAHHYGRSFFDVATLKNGEVGAVWLDGRFGKSEEGSAIFFNSTTKGQGFGTDRLIEKGTCECCRTDLQVDPEGNLHLAYRKILFPDELMGKQVRDMVYTTSKDNCQTFSPFKLISKDNWAIEGCPHTGPSLAVSDKKAGAIWFSAGGAPGLYFTQLAQQEKFAPRKMISSAGRHPQMLSLADSRLVTVWEEGATDHSSGGGHGGHGTSSASQVVVNLIKDGEIEKNLFRSDGTFADHHAVFTAVKGGVILAWIRDENNRSGINYTFISMD